MCSVQHNRKRYRMLAGAVLVGLLGVSCALLRCGQIVRQPHPRYIAIKKHARSGMSVIATTHAGTLTRCFAFAHRKNGLALNYIPRNKASDELYETCLVYDCPELGKSALTNNTQYNYYSFYATSNAYMNFSCISGVGVFWTGGPSNFSDAWESCEARGGKLASVLSETRTLGLASFIASLKLRWAYIGIDDIQVEGRFITTSDEPLSCSSYRAWAPGEPRSVHTNEDCVVLGPRRQWHVVDCSRRLPFLCELTPSEL